MRECARLFPVTAYGLCRLGFVIVSVPGNQLRHFEPPFDQLRQAAESVKPGEVIHLGAPKKRPV